MTHILRLALVAFTGSLLAACGGGGGSGDVAITLPPAVVPPEPPVYVAPPTVETFPVAAVMRQLAAGYTFTGFAADPDTGFPASLGSVTYAPTGPGAFERRHAVVEGDVRTEFTWSAAFSDAAPDGGLRFTAFRSATASQAPITGVHDLPETAIPEPPANGVLADPPQQYLFHNRSYSGPPSFSPEQWDYSWRLFRRSATRAELCLDMNLVTGDFFFFLHADADCFEIDGAGRIQKVRLVTKRGCCRIPTVTRTYE